MMSQLVWLVTGCSSGFGEQFVHSILARGDKVIATARNIEKVKHLEQVGAVIAQLDVTDSEENIRDVVSKAIQVYGRIDVLVNNAGNIVIGTWEDLEYVLVFADGTLTDGIEGTKIGSHSSTQTYLEPSK